MFKFLSIASAHLRAAPAAVSIVLLTVTPVSVAAAPIERGPWDAIDQLINDQKFEQAVSAVAALRVRAQAAGDRPNWTLALVREFQLRSGLGGFETAVRFLREQPWPDDPASQLILRLYYAQSLTRYAQVYGYEIRTRTRIETKRADTKQVDTKRDDAPGPIDLKAWTIDQIYAEADAQYATAWREREALGGQKTTVLTRYLVAGDYPAGVRDSLRDLVSYLWVAHLADTAGWTPAQSNERFQLSLGDLLAGASAPVTLDDATAHPARKISAILLDLQRWHDGQARGRATRSSTDAKAEMLDRTAALEARLELARRLFEIFSTEDERRMIIADLSDRLTAQRDLPWYAQGMLQQAVFLRTIGRPLEARAAAQVGRDAYPSERGGRQCAQLIAQIEAPSFEVSAMSADAPGKRSIRITHRNLARVYFRAYAIDFDKTLAGTDNPLPDTRTAHRLIGEDGRARRALLAQWVVDLPATPDYADHATDVVPPPLPLGMAMIVASALPSFAGDGNLIFATPLVVTDTVLVVRALPGRYEVQAFDADTGQPLPGVDVSLYQYSPQAPRQPIGTQRTGSDGLAELKQPSEQRGYFIVGRRGASFALAADFLNTGLAEAPSTGQSALVYTDRSIYRPQQSLKFKIVAYAVDNAERIRARVGTAAEPTAPARPYRVRTDANVRVRLLDANGQEVDHRDVRTNEFGSAAGQFVLPAGRLLGNWTVRADNGAASIRVEEYKRPTFEVTLLEAGEAYRLNRPARVRGQARYTFGVPVTVGDIRWTVRRVPMYPIWWYWRGGTADDTGQIVAGGSARLSADGGFEFTFTPKADERQARSSGISYRYEVNTELTDDSGETRTATRGFRLGFVAVEAQLLNDAGFMRAREPAQLLARRTDLDGVPLAGTGSFRLCALVPPPHATTPGEAPLPPQQVASNDAEISTNTLGTNTPATNTLATNTLATITPGDRIAARWSALQPLAASLRDWAAGAQIAQASLKHDARGEATIALPPLGAGAYRLTYETTDRFGAAYTTQTEFVVAADAGILPVAAALVPLRTSVEVGQTLDILVASGLAAQPLMIDYWRGDRRVRRQLVTLNASVAASLDAQTPAATNTDAQIGRSGLTERLSALSNMRVLSVPIDETLRGGFGITVTAVRDAQVMQLAQTIFVPWDKGDLKIEFASFRDKLTPGQKESWRVTVKAPASTPNGRPELAGAEVLAYMYDRSLDLFAPHQPPSPREVLPNLANAPWSYSTFGVRNAQTLYGNWPAIPGELPLQADRLQLDDGYAIGGMGRRRAGFPAAPAASLAMRARAKGEVADADKPDAGNVLRERLENRADGAKKQVATSAVDALKSPGEAGAKVAPEPAPRSNFSETAFFLPQLRTDADGSATIEFAVPDSVTGWSIWVHAMTRDLRSGSTRREARSVKDLMVRPQMPRFLRAGDDARLRVAVNNVSGRELAGNVRLSVTDPATGADAASVFGIDAASAVRPFRVAHDGTVTVVFPLKAPALAQSYAIKLTAESEGLSDGELRPLPVLPSRIELLQSRFVTLHDQQTKTLRFDDLKTADPTRINEQLVVTVDARLLTSVLAALPYLQSYPYECTEQTMNRFLSAGIVTSVFREQPALAKLAATLAKRTTKYEAFDRDDPNRRLALEESPWLAASRGKDAVDQDDAALARILDPLVAAAEREAALARLRQAQLPSGAFPWFAGGPESPVITLYLMAGFARAAEFGVPVPKDVIQRGWRYLATHFRAEYATRLMQRDCCWEWLTYLNFVAGSYPDASWVNDAISADERRAILDFSFAHWKQHSPYLKGMLTLSLKRGGRDADARKVWASVMDSAKSNDEQGTFWAPEDRSWLWYNDTIESHAFALRVMTEIDPTSPKRDGLIQWLLLNKKLNHWKSTRATAEAIYALVHAMKQDHSLGVREAVAVTVNRERTEMVFDPAEESGRRRQIVVDGPKVDAGSGDIRIEHLSPGFAFASATWRFSTEKLPDAERGDFFRVARRYFRRETTAGEVKLVPLADGAALRVGDQIEVQLSLRSLHEAQYVHLRDPRAAGVEPESQLSRHRYDLGLAYYEEVRDAGTNFFFERLPVGEYTFRYRLRASMAGTFRIGPATVQSIYAPEFGAYSTGARLSLRDR